MSIVEGVLADATLFQAFLVFGVATFVYLFLTSESWKLRHIPTVGFSSWPVLSIVSTIQFVLNSDKLLQEYHDRYKGRPFKISSLHEWIVILHDGVEDIKETMRLYTSVASSTEFTDRIFHLNYTIGEVSMDHPHTIALVKRLTHELANNIAEIRNEAEAAMGDILAIEDDWKGYNIEDISNRIVGRVTARVTVGETLCRNPAFLRICMQFSEKLFRTAMLMNLFVPSMLWPFASYFMSGTKPSVNGIRELVKPIIEESPYWGENSNNGQKSATPLDWMISFAKGYAGQYTIDGLSRRILHLSFASFSTASTVFRIALFNIAAHPEYIALLREEIEDALSDERWSKSSLDNMLKMDSFIQESVRTSPMSSIVAPRTMLKDHTLRDGTFLPRGTVVAHWTDGTNADNNVFENAQQFDGLRFYNMYMEGQKVGLTQPSPIFTMFGIGRHACPGRFFAVLEIKLLLAYILLNFDVKASPEQAGVQVKRRTIFDKTPATGQILLRRRQKQEWS